MDFNFEKTEDGEANFYGIVNRDNWVARIQFNGELLVSEQERILNLMLNSKKLQDACVKTIQQTTKEFAIANGFNEARKEVKKALKKTNQ